MRRSPSPVRLFAATSAAWISSARYPETDSAWTPERILETAAANMQATAERARNCAKAKKSASD